MDQRPKKLRTKKNNRDAHDGHEIIDMVCERSGEGHEAVNKTKRSWADQLERENIANMNCKRSGDLP